jgi:hypothetical protein
MCKQVFLTNTSKLNTKKLGQLLAIANTSLAKGHRDGFGWVARNTDGSLVGERYVNPNDYQFRHGKSILDTSFTCKDDSNYFGSIKKLSGALLIHGRISTNTKGIQNTHPFLKHEWALVHNGVIENSNPTKYDMQSSCDTEHLIDLMAKESVKSIESHVTGYYAFGAIDPSGMLHVVKDNIADLYCAKLNHIDSFIFASSVELIENISDGMGWKVSTIEKVKDNLHLVFSGNKLVSQATITPKGRSSYADSKSMLSLGRSMSQTSYYDDMYDTSGQWVETMPEDKTEFDWITNQHDIVYVDGTELDYDDFLFLPAEEKRKCTIFKGSEMVMFNERGY